MGQKTPATEWEKRIDTLMQEQAATLDPERRRELFNEVAAHPRRERAGAVLRGAAPVLRPQPPPARRRPVGAAAAGAVERRLAQRRRADSLMARFLVRRLTFALVLLAVTSSCGAVSDAARPGRRDVAARAVRVARAKSRPPARASIWIGVRPRSGGCGSSRAVRFDFGDSFLYNRPVGPLVARAAGEHGAARDRVAR